MYEAIEIFEEKGLTLKEVMLSCLFSYYESRFLYK